MESQTVTMIVDELFLGHPLHKEWDFGDMGKFQFFCEEEVCNAIHTHL